MAEEHRRALLVTADADSRTKDVRRATDALEAGGLTLLRRESARDKLAGLILSLRTEVDCVVLAGADATMSAGAIALRDTGLPLGILPFGDSHDLARRLSIPLDPAGAAGVILAAQTRRINLGSVNGRPFFNVASVGLSVQRARQLGAASRSRIGLGYALALLRTILFARKFSAIIRCGAVIHRVRTMQVTVGNGLFYQGGMAAGVAGLDGADFLGVYSLDPTGRWDLAFAAEPANVASIGALPQVTLVSSPVVEIVTRMPHPVSADGKVVTLTPARLSILPLAVSVYVPGETERAGSNGDGGLDADLTMRS